MVDERHDRLARILRELSERFGHGAFADVRRTVSILSDRVPDARREIRVLSVAADAGAFETLARTGPDALDLEMDRLAVHLDDRLGIRRDVVQPILHAIAYGLGRGNLPSTYGGGAHVAPKTESPPRRTNDQAGKAAPGAAHPPAGNGPAPAAAPRGHRDGDDSWIGLSDPVARPSGDETTRPAARDGTDLRASDATRVVRPPLLPLLCLYAGLLGHAFELVGLIMMQSNPNTNEFGELGWAISIKVLVVLLTFYIVFCYHKKKQQTVPLYMLWLLLPPFLFFALMSLPLARDTPDATGLYLYLLCAAAIALGGIVYLRRSPRIDAAFTR